MLALLRRRRASAACGGVAQEKPRKDVNRGRAPLAIGDSPMLLALDPTSPRSGYKANARGCRQMPEGLELIRKLRNEDRLPQLVVDRARRRRHGHDGPNPRGARPGRQEAKLGLVTPLETGGGTGQRRRRRPQRGAEARQPHRAARLGRYSSGHAGWFQPDGLHLTFEGAAAFARLLKKPLKHLPPPHNAV